MALKLHHLLLLAILAVVCLCSSDVVSSAALGGGRKDALVGGWKNVDPSDPDVVKYGKFAIDEHNKEAQTNLLFKTVVRAQTQVVSGINYKMVIQALDGAASNQYEAIVWVKSWLNFQQLTSFRKL